MATKKKRVTTLDLVLKSLNDIRDRMLPDLFHEEWINAKIQIQALYNALDDAKANRLLAHKDQDTAADILLKEANEFFGKLQVVMCLPRVVPMSKQSMQNVLTYLRQFMSLDVAQEHVQKILKDDVRQVFIENNPTDRAIWREYFKAACTSLMLDPKVERPVREACVFADAMLEVEKDRWAHSKE